MLMITKEQIDRFNRARVENFRRKVLQLAEADNPDLTCDPRLSRALDLIINRCDQLQVRSERGVADVFLAWLRHGPRILTNIGPATVLSEPGLEKQRVEAFLSALP